MAIREFSRTFGAPAAQSAQDEGRQELPKAMIWLNLGYRVGYRVEGPTADGKGTESKFISIPVGIPLDTQKPIDIKVRNEGMADLQAHQNQLLADLQELATQLEAGDETYLPGLEIQMRRVKDAIVAPVASATSVFARKNSLVAAPVVEAEKPKAK